jgi:CBS domain-containing protein
VNISDILRHKATQPPAAETPHGDTVVTIAPTETVSVLLTTLAEHNVGALVVCADDQVTGIVSERDVVRRLAERGAGMLDATVGEIMSTSVLSCTSKDPVDSVAETMTQRRIRHMPVIDDGQLVGIVSIGDVVSSRIRQLETDRGQLEQYIVG